MPRKKTAHAVETITPQETSTNTLDIIANSILTQLDTQQYDTIPDVTSTSNKLRNQIVISLLDAAKVYVLSNIEGEAVLRARVRALINLADIIVDELENQYD